MGAFLRFLIGAEALRHIPMPKKFDHLIRRVQLALAAFIAFAVVAILTCILVITYIVMQIVNA